MDTNQLANGTHVMQKSVQSIHSLPDASYSIFHLSEFLLPAAILKRSKRWRWSRLSHSYPFPKHTNYTPHKLHLRLLYTFPMYKNSLPNHRQHPQITNHQNNNDGNVDRWRHRAIPRVADKLQRALCRLLSDIIRLVEHIVRPL